MPHIRFHATEKQLSKLRNGHKVRIRQGEGRGLIISPENYDLVSRSFNRGKAIAIALSPDEITANMEVAHQMEGQGIYLFGHKFDHFLEKRGIRDTAYKLGDYAKPAVKTAVLAGLTALGSTAMAAPLAPFVPAGVLAGSYLANDYLDHPDKYQSNVGGPRNRIAPTTLQDQIEQNAIMNKLNAELGTNYGNLAQASVSNAVAHHERAMAQTRAVQQSEQGLGLRREVGSLGRMGGLVGGRHGLPPALVSQPLSVNFNQNRFLPVAFQAYHNS